MNIIKVVLCGECSVEDAHVESSSHCCASWFGVACGMIVFLKLGNHGVV